MSDRERQNRLREQTEDVEVSTRFYRDLFGFTETFRTPERGRPIQVELRLGAFTLGLAAIDVARDMHGITAGAGPPRAELVPRTHRPADSMPAAPRRPG